MRRHLLVTGPIILFFLLSCGGGSRGPSEAKSRIVKLPLTLGQLVTVQDTSGPSKVILPAAPGNGELISTFFTGQAPKEPISPVVKPLMAVLLDSTVSWPLSTPVEALFPIGRASAEEIQGVYSIDEGQTWFPTTTEVNGVTATVKLTDADRSLAVNRGGGSWRFLWLALKLVPYKADYSEKTVQFIRLAGQGPIDFPDGFQFTAILVHGMNSNAQDMLPIANELVRTKTFGVVYGLRYPWYRESEINGREFADLLKKLPAGMGGVTIIAHSLGGIVASWAIERERAPKVNHLIMVGTPRKRIKLTGLILEGRKAENLNDASDHSDHWAYLKELFNQRSIAQLIPTSYLLDSLNDHPNSPNNRTGYHLIAGSSDSWGFGVGKLICDALYGAGAVCDGLVLADYVLGLPYGAVTNGVVTKHLWHYNHSQLIRHPEAIKQLVELVRQTRFDVFAPRIEATFPHGQKMSDFWGWRLVLEITNRLTETLTTQELEFQHFDRTGLWRKSYWYDPVLITEWGGYQYIDSSYISPFAWVQSLTSNQVISLPLGLSAGEKTNDTAGTIRVVLPGQDSQFRPFSQIYEFTLFDQSGNGPSPPRLATIGRRPTGK